MIQPPVCLTLYQSELELIKEELIKLNRLHSVGQFIGLSVAGMGILSLLFPNLLASLITLDNLSKFSSIVLGGTFFSSINLFNKGDMMSLRKRQSVLEIFIKDYDNFDKKTQDERQSIEEECNTIIKKMKGL